MRKILCLALPALIAAACGSDGGSKPDAPADTGKSEAGPDVLRADAPSDMPVTPDAAVDAGIDGPATPDLPPAIDQLPATDQAEGKDRPPVIDVIQTIDSLPAMDGPTANEDVPQALDGPALDTGTVDSNTITSPDGRVFTIVAACESALSTASSLCPSTYDQAFVKVVGLPDAPPSTWTGVGACAEGSLVYVPQGGGTTSMYCYYGAYLSANEKVLIGSVDYNDIYGQCGQTDTVSLTQIHGTKPTCSSIDWTMRK